MVNIAIGKKVRLRQKGKKCSVEGCNDWCVSNDLCGKHNMAVRRYGSVHGGKDGHRKGVCYCGKEFVMVKTDQKYCSSKCYRNAPEYKKIAYERTKKHRESNKGKARARDTALTRLHTNNSCNKLEKLPCEVCGSSETQMHHINYKAVGRCEPVNNIVFLCRTHHNELHSWDSN